MPNCAVCGLKYSWFTVRSVYLCVDCERELCAKFSSEALLVIPKGPLWQCPNCGGDDVCNPRKIRGISSSEAGKLLLFSVLSYRFCRECRTAWAIPGGRTLRFASFTFGVPCILVGVGLLISPIWPLITEPTWTKADYQGVVYCIVLGGGALSVGLRLVRTAAQASRKRKEIGESSRSQAEPAPIIDPDIPIGGVGRDTGASLTSHVNALCPHCSATHRVHRDQLGRHAKCKCGQIFTLRDEVAERIRDAQKEGKSVF